MIKKYLPYFGWVASPMRYFPIYCVKKPRHSPAMPTFFALSIKKSLCQESGTYFLTITNLQVFWQDRKVFW